MTIKKPTAVIQSVAAIVMAIVLISNVQAESATNMRKSDQVSSDQYGVNSKIIYLGGLRFDLSVEEKLEVNIHQDVVSKSEGIGNNDVFDENLVDLEGSHDMSHLYTW